MWVALALAIAAQAADPAAMPAVKDPAALKLSPADMKWWQDAKFGMFIHWGLYAIPAQGEWYMNDKKVPAAAVSVVENTPALVTLANGRPPVSLELRIVPSLRRHAVPVQRTT